MKSLKIAMLVLAVLTQTAYGRDLGREKQREFHEERENRPPPEREQIDRHEFRFRLFEELEMTDSQKDEIKAMFEENREFTRGVHEQMREKFEEIKNAVENGMSQSEVEAAMDEIMNSERQIALQRIRLAFSLRQVLTEQQLEKLPADFIARMILPPQRQRDERNEHRFMDCH